MNSSSFGAALCGALFVSLMAGCSKEPAKHPEPAAALPAAKVRLAQASPQNQTVAEEVVGTVRAKTRATLEAKLSGRILEMPVHLGQAVRKGELVARLDASETKARLEQAQASLQQAERDWTRISSLFKDQAVTRSEYDRAEAQQRLAQAAVAEAQATMSHAEVLAPFDGLVSRKWMDVGDLASPGKPIIDLEDPTSLQLEADIPESMTGRIELGAALSVRLDGLESELDGRVAEISPSADPMTRTVRVKVALPPKRGLIPGRFARLLLPVGESAGVAVPKTALVQRGQLDLVFVVTNSRARLHLVKTGKRSGDLVSILSGLEAGESVVAEGANLLTDGQPVEVQ